MQLQKINKNVTQAIEATTKLGVMAISIVLLTNFLKLLSQEAFALIKIRTKENRADIPNIIKQLIKYQYSDYSLTLWELISPFQICSFALFQKQFQVLVSNLMRNQAKLMKFLFELISVLENYFSARAFTQFGQLEFEHSALDMTIEKVMIVTQYILFMFIQYILQMWIRSLSKKLGNPTISNNNNKSMLNSFNHSYAFTTGTVRSSAKKTYYQILEIPSSASMANVKQNYLRLAKIYHPDVYKGKDKGRFQKIQEAYKTLSDKLKRIKYDQEIGIGRKVDRGVQEEYVNKSTSQPNPQKPQNPMEYQRPTKEQAEEDLDEQFIKFFNKKPKTKFQEIRLHEQPQIRQMSEKERLRRHFKQAYQKPEVLYKAQQHKQFDEILNDQVNQKNRMYQDSVKQQKKNQQKFSSKGIRNTKVKIMIGFTLFLVCTIPLIKSYVTKYTLEKQEMDKLTILMNQITNDLQQLELRTRLKFQ